MRLAVASNPGGPNQKTDYNVEGWNTIGARACGEVLPCKIIDLTVYIYAYTPSNPSQKWGGSFSSCGTLYPHCVNIPFHPEAAGKYSARAPCSSGSLIGMMFVDTGGVGNFRETLTK